MCVYSAVMDHYQDRFRQWLEPTTAPQPLVWPTQSGPFVPGVDLVALRALIDEFKEAVAAAQRIDVLTKQPDCEDPEKAKLVARVAELERRLAAIEKPKRKARRK